MPKVKYTQLTTTVEGDIAVTATHGRKPFKKSPYPRWLRRDNAVALLDGAISSLEDHIATLDEKVTELDGHIDEFEEADAERTAAIVRSADQALQGPRPRQAPGHRGSSSAHSQTATHRPQEDQMRLFFRGDFRCPANARKRRLHPRLTTSR